MTLQSAIERELPFLRAEAEARMESRVTIWRLSARLTQDETTGEEVPAYEAIHTALPFRSDGGSSGDGGSRTITLAGIQYEQATGIAHFPAATLDLADDDLIDVTAGEFAGDMFRIVKAVRYDQKTARRVPIVEAIRPGGLP